MRQVVVDLTANSLVYFSSRRISILLSYLERTMNQLNPTLALAGVLAFVVATHVSGQMPSFPDQAVLPTNNSRSAYVAVEYG